MSNSFWLSRTLAKLGIGDWFTTMWDHDFDHDTPADTFVNAGGEMASKSINHIGNGASTDNLFIVVGIVEIFGIYGCVDGIGGGGVGTDDTMDNLKLELDDGTAQVDLTLANSDLTNNATVGTTIVKDAEDSVKMMVLEADAVKYHEGPVNRLFQNGIIVAKTGAITYIRASYTGDVNTDVTIEWHVRYVPKHSTASVTAV